MKILWIKQSASVLFAVLVIGIAGCVAVGGYDGAPGYYGGTSVGYGVDFYQPFGYDFGGWQQGYRVGPPLRGGFNRPGRAHSEQSGTPYHSAPQSRPMPSIPMHPRGGGSRGQRH